MAAAHGGIERVHYSNRRHRIIAARLESSLLAARVVSAVIIPDLLIAAAGEELGWSFYITTRTSISSPPVTGRPCQWIVPAGTID